MSSLVERLASIELFSELTGKEIKKVASYMTTSENTRHIANIDESSDSFSPTLVVRPTTSAVCDEGMPPLPTSRP